MSAAAMMDARHSKMVADDWHGVTDAKQRKKIQDKLAQRARRKRLREAKQSAQQLSGKRHTKVTCAGQGGHHCDLTSVRSARLESPDSLDLMPYLAKLSSSSVVSGRVSTEASIFEHATAISHELSTSMTVFGAMYINGNILGLTCCIVVPQRSQPASPDIPPSLRPTFLQLTTIHQTGVDRFPFPKLRDNLITLHTLIDEEEITRDLYTMPSFTIKTGMAPWDPHAWKIEKYFADKWGYLFY